MRPLPLLVALSLAMTAAAAPSPWTETVWNGEPAWSSENSGAVAVVSVARSRLIYLGGPDLRTNTLSAPTTLPAPVEGKPSPNWGGHRFWLGPQSRWSWPPLTEWEFSGAASARVGPGGVLELRHPQTNPAYPALTREYAWENGKLRATVTWKGGATPFYGMHVVAIDVPARLTARIHPWDRVPEGVVGVQGDDPKVKGVLPHPSSRLEGDQLVTTPGIRSAKVGYVPQALKVERGAWVISVEPGPHRGVALESPDFGYLTQTWVGDDSYAFCELEQLTPYLLPDPEGYCSSTIYFALRTR